MKVEIIKEFDCIKVGHKVDLPTDIAKDLIEKGFAKEATEAKESKPASQRKTKELKPETDTK